MNLGVRSALVDGALVHGDVSVENGRVAAVALPVGRGVGIAAPGFVDVHTHGFAGVDFAGATAAEIDRASLALTGTGVTLFQPTVPTMTVAEMSRALAEHASASYPGARFAGTHLEGPFLSPHFAGAHPVDLLRDPDLELTRRLIGSGRLAQMTLAPELPGAMELIGFLVDSGITVALGHSDADAACARAGLAKGAVALTHVFNASRPMHHRDPGIIGVALADSTVFVTAVVDHVHLSPEVSTIVARSVGDRLVAVTDAMAAAGSGDGQFTLAGQEVEVRGGRAQLGDGTIASSVLTMDAAFRNLVGLGLSLPRAAQATSSAPSRMIGVAPVTLAPGSPADIVILDDGLDVVATYVGGNQVFSR